MMTTPRRLLALASLMLLASCASNGGPAEPPAAGPGQVGLWVTTGVRAQLLQRAPDLPYSGAAQEGEVVVDPATRYQEMVGFGASLTDASAWLLMNKLTPQARSELLRELYAADGANFAFLRLTIGASDFSRTHYSFDDMPAGQTDPQLTRFSIDPNRADVLPVLKEALALNPQIKVMASPWSAPGWMKTTDSMIKGSLKPEFYDAFARYLVRYVDAYAAEGVPLWGLTVQNEPHYEPPDYPGMRVEPPARARLIGDHVGPLLAQTHPGLRILDWDHNWDEPDSPLTVLADPQAARYVSGVAWHCYAGNVAAQSQVHDAFPSKEVYFTECSGGEWYPAWADVLTSTARSLVVGSVRNWARGVLLWNIALDENHGPHLGGCPTCRGVVTIDSRSGAVTRNAEYYALSHASRFVRQGAQRVASGGGPLGEASVTFRNPDGTLVLVAVNSGADPQPLAVREGAHRFHTTLPARSVATLVWKEAP